MNLRSIFTCLLILVSFSLLAQAPYSFSYQAIARNASGQPLSSQNISVRFTITNPLGTGLYAETHQATTNSLGLVILSIGKGTVVSPFTDFEDLDWAGIEDKNLKVEIDPAGGSSFSIIGTSQLESVPFSMYAARAGNAKPEGAASGDLNGVYPNPTVQAIQGNPVSSTAPTNSQVLKWNGTEWAPATDASGSYSAGSGISIAGNVVTNTGDLSNTNEIQTLSITGNIISLSNSGGTVSVDPSSTNEIQVLSISGGTITLGNGGGSIVLPDASATNEIQTISQAAGTVSLSNGGGSFVLPDASATNELQTISHSAGTVSLSNGGGSFVLPDASATNELQTISHSAGTVSLSNGGGSFVLPDASATNELQTISHLAGTVSLSNGGGSFVLPDASATNELQTISLSGSDLTLSNGGGTVALPGGPGVWTTSGSTIYNANTGYVGIGTASPAAKLHINNTVGFTEALRIQGNGSWLSFYDGTLYDGFLWNNVGNISLGTSHLNSGGSLVFYSYGQERMRITPGGFVGIGIANPAYKFHVEAAGVAIHGRSTSSYGMYAYSGGHLGIYGYSNATGSAGIFGQSAYIGVEGITNAGSTDGSRQGVRGDNSGAATGWAGYFWGNVGVSGSFSKGSGSFKIDHPLDPEHKFLYHSFVESPDMKNIYDGVVTTDGSGLATVSMPDWFEALNKDFRYQLTVIGEFAQAIIFKKLENGSFQIKTSIPNVEVSWQLTGIRKDPFAEQYRIPIEQDKAPNQVGKYLHPDVYGKPMEQAIDYLPNRGYVNGEIKE